MKKLIINADDFGYCEAVNYGIIECYKQGIVSSTTIMANMPGFDHAVALLKDYPELGLGIHLTLTCKKPLGNGYKTLTDEQGNFFKDDKNGFDEEEVYQEWCLQMEKCLTAGLKIDHIDSHHHLHMKEEYANVIKRFVDTYPLPVRGQLDNLTVKQATLFGKFYKYNCTIEYLQDFLLHMEEEKVYDIMCHPAYMDTYLSNATSYATGRLVEYDVLTSKEMVAFLKEHQIQRITYPQL